VESFIRVGRERKKQLKPSAGSRGQQSGNQYIRERRGGTGEMTSGSSGKKGKRGLDLNGQT